LMHPPVALMTATRAPVANATWLPSGAQARSGPTCVARVLWRPEPPALMTVTLLYHVKAIRMLLGDHAGGP